VTVVEPDLVYLDASRLDRVSERDFEGPPTLVIEVLSPTTASADRGVKRQLSARYGVPHYWLVDPDARVVETYRLTRDTCEPGPQLTGTAPAALPPFPDLVLDAAALWADLTGRPPAVRPTRKRGEPSGSRVDGPAVFSA
jgi:Uma2 family endonuclease